jgi:hypothetical protein
MRSTTNMRKKTTTDFENQISVISWSKKSLTRIDGAMDGSIYTVSNLQSLAVGADNATTWSQGDTGSLPNNHRYYRF